MRIENRAALIVAAVGTLPHFSIAVLAIHKPVPKGGAVVPGKAGTQTTARLGWAPAFAGATSGGSVGVLPPGQAPGSRGFAVGASARFPVGVVAVQPSVSKRNAVVPAKAGTQSMARVGWAPAFAGATSGGSVGVLPPGQAPGSRGFAVGASARFPVGVVAVQPSVSKRNAVVPAKAGTQSMARVGWAPACAGATSGGSARVLPGLRVAVRLGGTDGTWRSAQCVLGSAVPLCGSACARPRRRGVQP